MRARARAMKQIYLVRHAHTRYDPDVADSLRPLTAKGHEQAAALVGVLRALAIEEIHTSPYRRCLDTIGPFAAHAGLQVNHVEDLRERTFTSSRVDDWESLWKTVWTDFDFAFPDGESSRVAQRRMHAATLQVARTSRARSLAISSHGNTIGLLLQQIDEEFTFEHACSIRNPDVLRVTFDGESLRWDRSFALESLAGFATRVETAVEIRTSAALVAAPGAAALPRAAPGSETERR
jgi:2,3-bisphosphoglycerate-dependent phosphoglycerate mutase